MAATLWNVQNSAKAGVAPTYNAIDATNGNRFKNTGLIRLHAKGNTGATGQIKVIAQKASYPGGVKDHILTTASALDATTKELELGPYDPAYYADGDGFTEIQYVGTMTGVTVAVTADAPL